MTMTLRDARDRIALPASERDFIPILQREGKDIVLLVDGKSYRLSEAQARHIKKDLERILTDGL